MPEREGNYKKVRRPHIIIPIATIPPINTIYDDLVVGAEPIQQPQPLELSIGDAVQYELIDTRATSKILTTIRRFVCTKNTQKNPIFHRQRQHQEINFREGDIIEELFDKPNVFYNISHFEREELKKIPRYDHCHYMEIYTINRENRRIEFKIHPHGQQHEIVDNSMFQAFEPMDNINTKDSVIFQMNTRKAVTMLRARQRKLAVINEEINNLNHILEIEEE